MSPPGPDDKILTYGDAVLRRSDLHILRTPSFINDRLIAFFFAHLAATHPSAVSGPLLLVPPAISFWIALCPDNTSLIEAIAPLRLPARNLVLFTVNNNADVTLPDGGTHWSLLAYDRSSNVFIHHDSCNGMNHPHARRLYCAVKTFFDWDPKFLEGPVPQQKNGYDCGVCLMASARVICDWFEYGKKDDRKWFQELETELRKEAVGNLRAEMLDLISSLGGRE